MQHERHVLKTRVFVSGYNHTRPELKPKHHDHAYILEVCGISTSVTQEHNLYKGGWWDPAWGGGSPFPHEAWKLRAYTVF